MTEWWYVNTHLTTADGRNLSVFAAFFRIVKGRDETTQEPIWAHSLTWALSDADGKRYLSDTLVDKEAPRLGLERLARAEESGAPGATKDPRVRRAVREMLERGQVPYPDHVFEEEPFVGERRLELDYDGNRFEKLDDGRYRLKLWHRYHEVGVELDFTPKKAPIRHGEDGVVRGPDGADMFYYFVPRCEVTGHVIMNALRVSATGSGWYDHEFGGHREANVDSADTVAWNWLAAQLADGRELTAYAMVDVADGSRPLGQRLVLIERMGAASWKRQELDAVRFVPLRPGTQY